MNQKNTVLIKRLKVIAGQITGVTRMMEQEREFTEIILQLSSIKAGLERVENLMIDNEIRSDKKTRELFKLFSKKNQLN